MVWDAGTDVPAGELSALADDAPLLVTRNELWDAIESRWQTNPTFGASANIEHTDYPGSNAYSGQPHIPTYATGTDDVFYFFVRIPESDVDVVIFKPHSKMEFGTVICDAADNTAFTGNAVTLANFGDIGITDQRQVSFSLAPTGTKRITGVQYIRLSFDNNAVNFPGNPRIGELIIGKRRQVSRKFEYGPDTYNSGVEFDSYRGPGRVSTRHKFAEKFWDVQGVWTPSGGDLFGLDDVATLKSAWAENGARLMAYCEDPSSNPELTRLGQLMMKEQAMMHEGVNSYSFDLNFEERPQFVREES